MVAVSATLAPGRATTVSACRAKLSMRPKNCTTSIQSVDRRTSPPRWKEGGCVLLFTSGCARNGGG
jgi:hypothetical protein